MYKIQNYDFLSPDKMGYICNPSSFIWDAIAQASVSNHRFTTPR
ncbi:hypothetical protein [Nostoc sp. T09]|nr:hypothetical protein [Nostoc sp. T09]